MAKITRVTAREVLDSRGHPTLEAEVVIDDRVVGRAMVPSGASTGSGEALELRDGDPARFAGKGVRKAVGHVRNELARAVVGRDPYDQQGVDEALRDADGTPDKSRLGANAILGVSLATARAAALSLGLPLYRYLGGAKANRMPVPMVNMISGGRHSENRLDMQDFLIIPVGAATYSEALVQIAAVYASLRRVLQRHGAFTPGVADEGGFGPELARHEDALEYLVAAIEEAGLVPGQDVFLAVDVAATQFYEAGTYHLSREGRRLAAQEMVGLLAGWVDRYPILSIEDGMAEGDHAGWVALTGALGGRVQLIGDDFFVTDARRVREGAARGQANAVLVKVNQIGTLTEALDVVSVAESLGYLSVVSARSGETEDPFIADLAVATGAGQIKIGSITRSERTAKYNQLLRIEEELGEGAEYPGKAVFQRFLAARG